MVKAGGVDEVGVGAGILDVCCFFWLVEVRPGKGDLEQLGVSICQCHSEKAGVSL